MCTYELHVPEFITDQSKIQLTVTLNGQAVPAHLIKLGPIDIVELVQQEDEDGYQYVKRYKVIWNQLIHPTREPKSRESD